MSALPEHHQPESASAQPFGTIYGLPEAVVVAVVIAAALLAVYWGSSGCEFIRNWDDNKYLVDNAAAHGFSLANVQEASRRSFVGNYAPLHIVSYMADYTLWGLNPYYSRLVNVLLHGINGVLFFCLLRRMSWQLLPALLAVLLFILHPVQVESVAWVSQRKSVLAMAFTLTAMLCYLRGKEQPSAPFRYLPALAAFTMALLTKSAVVFLPAALLVYELTIGTKRRWPELLRLIVPCAALALLFCAITLASQHEARTGWHGGSPLATFATMAPVALRYLGMVLLPLRLSALYDPPLYHSLLELPVAAALLLLSVVGVAVWLWGKRQPQVWFWGAFALLALLPVSQLVPITTLINDRYLYFPLLGVTALLASGVTPLLNSSSLRGIGGRCLIVVLLVLLALLANRRVQVWHDDLTLWSDAVQKAPGNRFARQGLAEALEARGDLAGAAAQYLVALQKDPDAPDLNSQAGVVMAQLGDFGRAIPLMRRAQQLKPDNSAYRNNLAAALLESGAYREAIVELHAAERAAVPTSRTSCMLGALYEKTGAAAAAAAQYQKARQLDGGKADEECAAIRKLLGLP